MSSEQMYSTTILRTVRTPEDTMRVRIDAPLRCDRGANASTNRRTSAVQQRYEFEYDRGTNLNTIEARIRIQTETEVRI